MIRKYFKKTKMKKMKNMPYTYTAINQIYLYPQLLLIDCGSLIQ